MIAYPTTGEPRWCHKMPTGATFRAFVHLDKFLEAQDCLKGRPSNAFRRISNPIWGKEDLQKAEAINIVKDMIRLSETTQNP